MNLPLAPRPRRLLAVTLDSLLILAVYAAFRSGQPPEPCLGILSIVLVAQGCLLTVQGQSLGKWACGIRIVRADSGENGGFWANVGLRVIVNGALCLIPFYALADALFIFRADRRCLHDLIAGTVVIESLAAPDALPEPA